MRIDELQEGRPHRIDAIENGMSAMTLDTLSHRGTHRDDADIPSTTTIVDITRIPIMVDGRAAMHDGATAMLLI